MYRSELVEGTDIGALRFLWSDYECHVYYFEVFEILRRLLLTAGRPDGVALGVWILVNVGRLWVVRTEYFWGSLVCLPMNTNTPEVVTARTGSLSSRRVAVCRPYWA